MSNKWLTHLYYFLLVTVHYCSISILTLCPPKLVLIMTIVLFNYNVYLGSEFQINNLEDHSISWFILLLLKNHVTVYHSFTCNLPLLSDAFKISSLSSLFSISLNIPNVNLFWLILFWDSLWSLNLRSHVSESSWKILSYILFQ